jgi:glycosyltransferase involved in cell wall biosynthesis
VTSVAITHDYLTQRGGGERVVLELLKLWPEAQVATLAYDAASTFPEFASHQVRESLLGPLRGHPAMRALAPLYPLAFRAFGRFDQDLVISSSSGWAHQVATSSPSRHVIYMHTPARWVYAPRRYFGGGWKLALAVPLTGALRRLDRAAARRADLFLCNSRNVQERVARIYGVDAQVVFPPVDTARFTPKPRGERLLVLSRLFPYKWVELVVDAANRTGIGLDVVGAGPALAELRELAGPTVTFHGRLDDRAVTELVEGCRALVLPGTEEFGIVAVEANAAGKPVIAFAAGGALETQRDGVTAALFHEHTSEALLAAIARADALETSPEELAERAERFSRPAFRNAIGKRIQPILG